MSSACRVGALLILAWASGCGWRTPSDYPEVRAIVDRHCVSCHSEHNASTVFPFAPSGVKFDELVEHLFRSQAFPTGAVLLTGAGIVPDDAFTLNPGDSVRITISGIGTLENPVAVV